MQRKQLYFALNAAKQRWKRFYGQQLLLLDAKATHVSSSEELMACVSSALVYGMDCVDRASFLQILLRFTLLKSKFKVLNLLMARWQAKLQCK